MCPSIYHKILLSLEVNVKCLDAGISAKIFALQQRDDFIGKFVEHLA